MRLTTSDADRLLAYWTPLLKGVLDRLSDVRGSAWDSATIRAPTSTRMPPICGFETSPGCCGICERLGETGLNIHFFTTILAARPL